MSFPKRAWLVGHPEHGDIWLSRDSPEDIKRLWEPGQRQEYVLVPRKRKAPRGGKKSR